MFTFYNRTSRRPFRRRSPRPFHHKTREGHRGILPAHGPPWSRVVAAVAGTPRSSSGRWANTWKTIFVRRQDAMAAGTAKDAIDFSY